MNIREAAAELNTTPKSLRRILRRTPSFSTVGFGGVYDLTPEHLDVLRAIVNPAKEKPMPFPELDQDPGFDPVLLTAMRRNPATRSEKLARRAARRARLAARLSDPEVAAFCAEQRRLEAERAARRWAPVTSTEWHAGVDLITADH